MRMGKRRISKRLALILVPVVLVFAGAGAAFAAGAVSFKDIAGNAHEQSILKEAAQGVAGGFQDGTFKPDQPVTRGQMMTFLDRFNSGITCTQCHNSGTKLTSKVSAWETSVHGDVAGNVFLAEGTNASCASCHSGGGFATMIAAGKSPKDATVGDPNPTPQDCRTCHLIHTTYTDADYALRTRAAVTLQVLPAGTTYDGGAGNLCANCHQPRAVFPAADASGNVAVSLHFGPHQGPQSAILLGLAGAGATKGSQSPHYSVVKDTCVTCHMGPVSDSNPGADLSNERPNAGHTFLPSVNTCVSCHKDTKNFDVDGVQTKVKDLMAQLKAALVAKGLVKADGTIVAGTYPQKQAQAVWNYNMILADRSNGVHNPAYIQALLNDSIALLK